MATFSRVVTLVSLISTNNSSYLPYKTNQHTNNLSKFMSLSVKVVCLYLCFYIEYMASFTLELQFMVIVMKIVSAQKTINNALMDLVYQIDTRGISRGRILSRWSNFEGSTNHPILTIYFIVNPLYRDPRLSSRRINISTIKIIYN